MVLMCNLVSILYGFDRLTGLTKYSLFTAPRPCSPVSPAEQAAPLGRRVSGDRVLIQTYMHPIRSSRCNCSTHYSNLKQLIPPVSITPAAARAT